MLKAAVVLPTVAALNSGIMSRAEAKSDNINKKKDNEDGEVKGKIPETGIFYLTSAVTNSFKKNGDFEFVFTLKKDGGFDIYLNSDAERKDSAVTSMQDIGFEDQLFEGEATEGKEYILNMQRDFKKLGPAPVTPAVQKATIKEIVEGRTIKHIGAPLSWFTTYPKENVPGSNCGTACAFGYCWVTP